MHWLALFIAVLANATANVAFKKAMTGPLLGSGFSPLIKLAADPWMWIGLASACLLLGSYLFALKEIELSVAYPAVTGLAMLAVGVAGATLLGESMSVPKLIAMALIAVGVVLLKFSA